MKWKPTCRNVRHSLALWSGNDLDLADQAVVQRHLAVCPECREQWRRLQAGRQSLEAVRAVPEERPLSASIWPAVERQILAGEQPRAAADWRAWLPTGALAAACLALFVRLPLPGGSESAGDSRTAPIVNSQPAWWLDEPSNSEGRPVSPLMGLPETMRVRTLLDGTDVRDL